MNTAPLLLIVDDDPEERYMMQMALTDIGWNDAVLFFHSAEAFLHHLALLHPDQYPAMLLFDYHMPGINGGELLQMLKHSASFRYLPILIYSTQLSPDLQRDLIATGALKCYRKARTFEEATAFATTLKQMCLQHLQHH